MHGDSARCTVRGVFGRMIRAHGRVPCPERQAGPERTESSRRHRRQLLLTRRVGPSSPALRCKLVIDARTCRGMPTRPWSGAFMSAYIVRTARQQGLVFRQTLL